MALQIWLPFNGNLKNQGICNTTIANGGATSNSAGKIGKCYSFDGSDDYISLTSSAIYSTFAGGSTPFSIAFWVYHADSTRAIIFGDYQLSGSISFNVELTTSHLVRFYWNGNPDKTFANSSVELNTWTHICITYDGSELLMYKNGNVLSDSYTGVLTAKSKTSGSFYLGRDNRTGSTALYGKLNDFRIYDHCLSPKEVKEISKGLMLHYPLNSQYEVGSINKINGTYSEGQFSSSSFSKSKLADERGWHYTYRYTGTTANTWPNASSPAFSYTIGKTYYYSLKVRCNTWTAGELRLRASRSSNDYATNTVLICNSSKADGQWHEYYTYIKITGDTYDRSGTQVACSPRLEVYCSNLNSSGTVYTFDFDIKDMQVVESDTYLPYINNSFTTNIIQDTSGFRYNGNTSGALNISTNSPRYVYNTVFNGSSLIDAPFSPPSNLPFTISGWFYHISGTTYYGCKNTYTTYICLEDKRYFLYNSGGTAYVGNYTSTDNVWQHIVLVNDVSNNVLKLYINGNYVSQVATNGTVYTSDMLNIGGRQGNAQYNGKISDFRIYATALSADDIKELYNTSAFICNNGTLCAYEFDEETTSTPNINKTGVIVSNTYDEGFDVAAIYNNKIESKQLIEI